MELPAGVRFGAEPLRNGTRFTVWSGSADRISICIFDPDTGAEVDRVAMTRNADGIHSAVVPKVGPGARYGLRADGPHDPASGFWFDPAKLLVDPYAVELDRPFGYDPLLASPRAAKVDTAELMPKAIVPAPGRAVRRAAPVFRPGGLIYELSVRGFTMLHPEVPEAQRGTVAALAHPAVIAHLKAIGVDAVELMPITAWIDERHLGPLGLSNAWGYNPVAMMALDPRLCPGGVAELRGTVAALRKAGIGVILDLVFNHTGESDAFGPTLSLRGLDARAYFRTGPQGQLINDTGCGNTLACERPAMRRLVLDTLRHFVRAAGVDGFRFDLAPILGRSMEGFDPNARLLREIAADPLLSDRVLIAEPWDIGPGGYQLGRFPEPFLEWSDTFRDRVRRFWRGDNHMLGPFATALAGSSDAFSGTHTRVVNFIAAHDGFSLADLTAYAHKHNDANGEENRDGHNDNHSWNNGAEGPTRDTAILAARERDLRALLATLFAARGTIMLTAGDEFGRSQHGNNNAYAQDNAITWLDWRGRDRALEAWCGELARIRRAHPRLSDPRFLTGKAAPDGVPDVVWLAPDGVEMHAGHWEHPEAPAVTMILGPTTPGATRPGRLAVLFNRGHDEMVFALPPREGFAWVEPAVTLPGRSVRFVEEAPVKASRRRRPRA
ncbi:glycogen debranching protein GlgX [Amaricoccus solimangrovi]|uniref:Glycogen debranching protein GlgX n=1 Tax=Amaricoccus solimangrovi TaxID=2589815 RepID=A0A501WTV4_9RHOB|nr:glycogen debranching protein GlgX [Amaricoccus solimangrovi]TPE50777.1 glycogen debranching protein GlgX [Amaricoccus solimangrovi]